MQLLIRLLTNKTFMAAVGTILALLLSSLTGIDDGKIGASLTAIYTAVMGLF